MAGQLIVCTRTQKPGHYDWIVMYPADAEVKVTIFGTQDEIEDGVRRHLSTVYPNQELELSFRDVRFEDLFGLAN